MKTGLITGASGAIGGAIALQLAEEGYSLYLHYNENEERIEALKRELESRYSDQDFYKWQADFSTPEGIFQTVKGLPKHQIEVIVHNSGHSHIGLVQDVTNHEFDHMVFHHMKAPFLLTQALLPHMIQGKHGRIIFISSIWGLTGSSMEVIYSMVKGAQNSLCKALAKELAPSGITVNAIAPGAIESNMLNAFRQDELEELKADIPMGRFGEPNEVASLVRYLCQPEAAYITGQVLSINGGWYC